MFNYTDSTNDVICISFDNSAEVSSFYKQLNAINSTITSNLYKYYVPYKSKVSNVYNYYQFNATYLASEYGVKLVYFGGEILRTGSVGKF